MVLDTSCVAIVVGVRVLTIIIETKNYLINLRPGFEIEKQFKEWLF